MSYLSPRVAGYPPAVLTDDAVKVQAVFQAPLLLSETNQLLVVAAPSNGLSRNFSLGNLTRGILLHVPTICLNTSREVIQLHFHTHGSLTEGDFLPHSSLIHHNDWPWTDLWLDEYRIGLLDMEDEFQAV
ncbi:hypothetical protein RRG08_049089 [Elysia crispata]|uniref:Uncharacterized protein n=1 Tax=Elysia crispata TaxID=231223 RepID=A0AAE1A9V9_9GAST|nr:hypothetical protein RRG08_049089 [Elysia crispata]